MKGFYHSISDCLKIFVLHNECVTAIIIGFVKENLFYVAITHVRNYASFFSGSMHVRRQCMRQHIVELLTIFLSLKGWTLLRLFSFSLQIL